LGFFTNEAASVGYTRPHCLSSNRISSYSPCTFQCNPSQVIDLFFTDSCSAHPAFNPNTSKIVQRILQIVQTHKLHATTGKGIRRNS